VTGTWDRDLAPSAIASRSLGFAVARSRQAVPLRARDDRRRQSIRLAAQFIVQAAYITHVPAAADSLFEVAIVDVRGRTCNGPPGGYAMGFANSKRWTRQNFLIIATASSARIDASVDASTLRPLSPAAA
jgi:hypothetical protein